jgi:hypothetical protein
LKLNRLDLYCFGKHFYDSFRDDSEEFVVIVAKNHAHFLWAALDHVNIDLPRYGSTGIVYMVPVSSDDVDSEAEGTCGHQPFIISYPLRVFV